MVTFAFLLNFEKYIFALRNKIAKIAACFFKNKTFNLNERGVSVKKSLQYDTSFVRDEDGERLNGASVVIKYSKVIKSGY